MENICIIGATSAIATACAERLIDAKGELNFVLLGRNESKLRDLSAKLSCKGASEVTYHILDIAKFEHYDEVIQAVAKDFGKFDTVIVAHATTPDQKTCEIDSNKALAEFFINGTSVISLLTKFTSKGLVNDGGTIIVFSSVAGDRGRRSNYVYGSAKAAITSFTSGLRARLIDQNINVLTVKPGYVDTPLNDGIDLPKCMVASPQYVALKIVSAMTKRKSVIYVPFFWYFIMLVIRAIPETIFKRLNF